MFNANATAVRLADRYIGTESPLSIARTGQLERWLWFSGIVCSFALITVMYIGHNSKDHHVVIHDVDVAFELTCAPPEPSFRAVDRLVPLNFEEGQKPAALANKQNELQKTANEEDKIAQDKAVKPHLASAVSEQAPIAVAQPAIPSPPVAHNPMADIFGGAAAVAATPAQASSQTGGGSADGQAGATGAGGSGSGAGHGDMNALAGGDFGAANAISMRTGPVAMGNIGPYKRQILSRIKEVWHPTDDYGTVTVEILVDRHGHVLEKQVVKSSGSDHVDTSLLSALDSAQLSALPDWYRGNELRIKLVLRST
jgi:TonB family protein